MVAKIKLFFVLLFLYNVDFCMEVPSQLIEIRDSKDTVITTLNEQQKNILINNCLTLKRSAGDSTVNSTLLISRRNK